MSNNKSENKKRRVMTLILKVISGLLIATVIFMLVLAALLEWGRPTVANHPSGEEIERMREDAKQMSF